jgi:DNA processing protein
MSPILDPLLHGRLIVLAGLSDLRSDTLAFLLRTHTVDHIWNAIRSGSELQFLRRGKVITVPHHRVLQWGSEVRASDPDEAARAHQRAGVYVVGIGDPLYPPAFETLNDPPGVVFVQGDPRVLHDSSEWSGRAGIVGTRRASSYGRQVARALGRSLSVAGVTVVSGLASGIDGAAHNGVLSGRTPTDAPPLAVVGSGLDYVYPRDNRELWDAVRRNGALVSEWPLGVKPIAWHFPARNRLIVALSQALVVVESGLGGGSMITVRLAQDHGVPVLSVPGLLSSPVSAGPHELLSAGGPICRDATDVLVAMGRLDPPRRRGARSEQRRPGVDSQPQDGAVLTAAPSFDAAGVDGGGGRQSSLFSNDHRRTPSPDGAAVLAGLGWDVVPVDTLLDRFPGTSPGTLLLTLHELEFDGWVARGSDGWFQLATRARLLA